MPMSKPFPVLAVGANGEGETGEGFAEFDRTTGFVAGHNVAVGAHGFTVEATAAPPTGATGFDVEGFDRTM